MHRLLHYFLLAAILLSPAAFAEESGLSSTERLKNDQEAVSGRYARFERLLSQMADILRHEDPERAELLRRAISKGREQAISSELDVIARRLGEGDYGAAREKQKDVESSLLLVLKLLQSEDRRSAVEKERERLNNILKGIRNTITQERAARGNALNSKAPSSAAPAQQKALKSADGLLDDIKEHDDQNRPADEEAGSEGESNSDNDNSSSGDKQSNKSNGKEQGDGKSESGKSSDSEGENGESENGGSENGESEKGESKDGEPKESGDPKNGKTPKDETGKDGDQKSNGDSDSKSSSQSDSEQQESKQSGGGSQQSQESQSKKSGGQQPAGGQQSQQQDDPKEEQTPGREQLEQARNLMQEALEQLKKQERDNAVDKQDAALAELQKAERKLEEQLRQLREEEKEMLLAALEARLQRLLAVQTEINEYTIGLGATPRDEWLDNSIDECRRIRQLQAELTQECSQTTSLLREDGTSVSILVSMEDIEADMGTVSDRIRDTKVFALTQSIQSDIVEALEELIKATQEEMEEMKEQQRQQQQQQQSGQQEKPPLVELMAEIRVLRSLQMRVNRRMQQVDDLLDQPDPNDVDALNSQVQELSLRQQRLRESAAELAERMER